MSQVCNLTYMLGHCSQSSGTHAPVWVSGSMIYLDYNATTPLDPAVAEAMQPFVGKLYGNPSSQHAMGRRIRAAIDEARGCVANLLGASPEEIVFTSGGTESNNMVIQGAARTYGHRGKHIVTSCIEHPSVSAPCEALEADGFTVTRVKVDEHGLVDPDEVIKAITDQTILITIMLANNEVGTIEPLARISHLAHRAGVLVHTDAAQAVGKISVRIPELGVDFLTVAGHKLYAPPGIGALYIKSALQLAPLMRGAGHEQGRRPGTENAAGIVGLGKACEVAKSHVADNGLVEIRDYFRLELQAAFGEQVTLNGHPQLRLPNTLNVSFGGHVGSEILMKLDGVCATTGSACRDGSASPSGVLAAMGIDQNRAAGAIRFSVGRFTTTEEIDQVVGQLKQLLG